MTTLRLRAAAAVIGLALLAGGVGAVAPPATALDTERTSGEIVIEPTTGRVFVTEGDSVGVYDRNGKRLTSIPDQYGASDLILNGSTLYVVARTVSRINRIDVTAMAMVGGWSVAVAPMPYSGALANGKIWFTFGDQWETLASLDLTSGVVTPDVGAGTIRAGSDIAADDANDRLYVMDRGLSPSKISSYDLSTGTPTWIATSPHSNGCSNGRELVMSPDGTTAWTACGYPYAFNEWNLATLGAPAVTYGAQPYPVGIAVSNDGAYLAGTMQYGASGVAVYATGRPSMLAWFPTSSEPAEGMVAIAPGNSRVYVGMRNGSLITFDLQPSTTSVSPSRIIRGQRTTITVTGSRLTEVTAATVGGRSVNPVVASDTKLTFTLPADVPAGSQAVVLSNRWGTSASTPATVRVVDLGPFASPDAAVNRLYGDLLGRAPTATERSTWSADLLAERQTPATLIRSMRSSPDNIGVVDPMMRLYRAYFLRTPDASGVTYWIDKRRTGTSEVQVSQSFANSSEFKNRYGTLANRTFVEQVYRNVLGRNGDAGGVAYWTKQLDTKARNRGAVMLGFSNSNEYVRTQAANVTASALHVLLLGRAPTAAEITSVTTALSGGADVATLADAILRSPEYARRIG